VPRLVENPPNPWASSEIDWEGEPPRAELEVYAEEAKTALVKNDSPDVGYRWGVNPYRGCFHGCSYCYARPTHEYLGFGAGTDFERKIVVKTNIAERLRAELWAPKWQREVIAFSGVTDCYQPLEAAWRLTRACLEACAERSNPVGIITKSGIVARDIDVLTEIHRRSHARVIMSIPFASDEMARKFEPYAALVSKRFETLRLLSEAGIATGVAVSPIIPGVNDSDIPAVLERARDAGATATFMTLLRLPGSVREVFDVRLEEVLPDRARKVRNAVREMRGGKMNESAFGRRMSGTGERWRIIEQLFEQHRTRLGYGDWTESEAAPRAKETAAAVATAAETQRRQLALFE
jgi:DNA repair photolyase